MAVICKLAALAGVRTFILGFDQRGNAECFLADLRERLERFNLHLHPNNDGAHRVRPLAADRRRARGGGKPETFDSPGFTHFCSTTRRGRFTVKRKTARDRMPRKLLEVRVELRRRMHEPVREVRRWLGDVVRGHTRYYGVPGDSAALWTFH